MIRNKKAISGVVVTVLLVLIAIIAIGILWYAIRGTIQKGADESEKSTQCFYLNMDIDSVKVSSVTAGTPPATTYTANIAVKRDTGEAELKGLKILINGVEKKQVLSTDTPGPPSELDLKTYTITGLDSKPTKVEIAGVLADNKICPISAKAEGNEIESF